MAARLPAGPAPIMMMGSCFRGTGALSKDPASPQSIQTFAAAIMRLMRSPFPGMDPYLEDPAFWPDFHRTFINYLREALLDRLPKHYDARIDEQLRLVNFDEETRRIYPDVAILHDPARLPSPRSPTPTSSNIATLEPITIPAPIRAEVRDVWIEIRHLPDQSVVTVIEVLSPSNKIGRGHLEYLAKRDAILNRPVSLVEIDLLLAGQRLDFGPKTPHSSYAAFISRDNNRKWIDVYAWDLRSPLPPIRIPLRPPDPDVILPLGDVFATTFQHGHYARALRYQNAPPAPLSEDQAEWARQILAAKL